MRQWGIWQHSSIWCHVVGVLGKLLRRTSWDLHISYLETAMFVQKWFCNCYISIKATVSCSLLLLTWVWHSIVQMTSYLGLGVVVLSCKTGLIYFSSWCIFRFVQLGLLLYTRFSCFNFIQLCTSVLFEGLQQVLLVDTSVYKFSKSMYFQM